MGFLCDIMGRAVVLFRRPVSVWCIVFIVGGACAFFWLNPPITPSLMLLLAFLIDAGAHGYVRPPASIPPPPRHPSPGAKRQERPEGLPEPPTAAEVIAQDGADAPATNGHHPDDAIDTTDIIHPALNLPPLDPAQKPSRERSAQVLGIGGMGRWSG